MDLDIYGVYYWIQSSQSTQPLNRETTEAPSRSETLDFRHEFLGESSYKNFQMSNVFGSNLVGCPCSEAKVAQVQTSSCAYMFTAIPCLHRVWTIRQIRYHQCSSWLLWMEKHYNAFLLEMPLEMKPKHAILLYAIQIMMHRIRFI